MTRATLVALLLLGGIAAVATSQGRADALRPSDEALLREIRAADGDALGPALERGFERFVERMGEFELDPAERLARALHARAAAPWSAENLALVLGRRGATEEATAVLDGALDRLSGGPDRAQLVHTRGLLRIGAGRGAAGRQDLGRAWAHGSAGAGLVLARIALAEGHTERARALARALLTEDPGTPWVGRIWGLSMLRSDPDSPR